MSHVGSLPTALDILGWSVILPDDRITIESLYEDERSRIDEQLSKLSPTLRGKLENQLGITSVANFGKRPSAEAGTHAARAALTRADQPAARLGLIVDYSTYAADSPAIWSLAHEVQDHLQASNAFSLGARGSGCAGLHAALLTVASMFAANSPLELALLVAADRAPDGGRSCLPISFMADAASAIVVGRAGSHPHPMARIHAISVQQVGRFSRLLVVDGNPPRMSVDGEAFERHVLPLHFVMLHRVLGRALGHSGLTLADLDGVVYPNTSDLDRAGIARGFGLSTSALVGPGPRTLGHAFANDMLINASSMLDQCAAARGCVSHRRTAWLAAGSGFTWGAAIVELGCGDVAG